MKVLLNWLRELVPIHADAAELCARLTLGGLAVDACEELGGEIRSVIAGEILSVTLHPRADRLTVCAVRTGTEPAVEVVCGAPNVAAGARVAYAPPGTVLPGGRRIEAAVIRGVASAGMLCSEAELGLAAASPEGILILGSDAPLGGRVGEYLGVEDTLIDIDVTPNRGDCLSILGIAREIAALTGQRLNRTRYAMRERGAPAAGAVTVRIADPAGCPRYAARLVRGVTIGPSPRWLARRLEAVGIRPINNVVDVTNFVMIERGQPLHAFDFDRLPEPRIVVRRAGATASLRTLDGIDRALAPDDLLITTGDTPVAIAGIMGGANSEVGGDTRTVLLESACFDPASIRRTVRRLDLGSESSYRFERGVDVDGVPVALDRAAALLEQLAGGEVARGVVESYPVPVLPAAICVRQNRVEDILGVALSRVEVAQTLKALGASVSTGLHGDLSVVPPTYRGDMRREIDVIEEVARVVGYGRIPATMPAVPMGGGEVPERWLWERELKRVLVASGFHEAICTSFASVRGNELFPGLAAAGSAVALLNPVNRDEPELRRSMFEGLLAAWRTNRNQGARGLAAFSIGRVFWQEAEPSEAWRLGGILAGELPRRGLGPALAAEFADAKGAVELLLERLGVAELVEWDRWQGSSLHPGKSARLRIGAEVVGVVGCPHPEIAAELGLEGACWLFELDTEKLLVYRPPRLVFTGLARFPAVVRDVAVVVDGDFASENIVRFVRQWRPDLVAEVAMFDAYIGAPIPSGKKSLAYTIAYRSAERTLTDEEINTLHADLVAALGRELGVELRH